MVGGVMNPATEVVQQLSGLTSRPACDDIRVTRAWALDTWAWISFRYDQRESRRRDSYALGAVVCWDLLDTLMDLPAGHPVPMAAVTMPARRRLAVAAPGVVRISGGKVTRDLVPAVTPLLAIVAARNWADGLIRASRFAPYCRRLVVGPDLPGAAEVMDQAGRLGIGVAARTGAGHVEVLLEPEPVPDWQPTTAWWRFCEVTYGQAVQRG
jgi:hypothetical protein